MNDSYILWCPVTLNSYLMIKDNLFLKEMETTSNAFNIVTKVQILPLCV